MKPDDLSNLSHDCRGSMDDLTTGNNSLNTDSDEECSGCKNDQSEFIHKLKKLVKDLERKLECAELNLTCEKEKNILLREKDELNKDFRSSIELSSRDKDVIINQLQSKIAEFHNSKSTMQDRIEKLEIDMKVKISHIAQLESQKNILLREKDELNIAFRSSIESSSQNQDIVKQLEGQISELHNSQSTMQDRIKKLNLEVVKKEEYIARLKTQLESPFSHKIEMYYTNYEMGCPTFWARFEDMPFSGEWMLIQSSMDPCLTFFSNSRNYLDGFGDPFMEYWLGCKKLHNFTKSQRHELFITLKNFDDKWTYIHYDNFLIGSESDGFKINALGSYTGNASDFYRCCWKQLLKMNYTDCNLNANDPQAQAKIKRLDIKCFEMYIRPKKEDKYV